MRPLHSCIAGQIAERIKGRYVVRVGLPTGYQADRGRSAPHGVPPAKIRTGGFPAYGSHLGCLTAKRSLGQG